MMNYIAKRPIRHTDTGLTVSGEFRIEGANRLAQLFCPVTDRDAANERNGEFMKKSTGGNETGSPPGDVSAIQPGFSLRISSWLSPSQKLSILPGHEAG